MPTLYLGDYYRLTHDLVIDQDGVTETIPTGTRFGYRGSRTRGQRAQYIVVFGDAIGTRMVDEGIERICERICKWTV